MLVHNFITISLDLGYIRCLERFQERQSTSSDSRLGTGILYLWKTSQELMPTIKGMRSHGFSIHSTDVIQKNVIHKTKISVIHPQTHSKLPPTNQFIQ